MINNNDKHLEKDIPLVYVLLAAYNGMRWIDEQVQSILDQKKVNIHLIISVDLSTDLTYEWCKKLATNNSRVKVLPYGERFGSAAKNFYRLIVDMSFPSPDYIALSDQDDIWLPNKIFTAINKMNVTLSDGYSSNLTCFDLENKKEHLLKKDHPSAKFDYLFQAGSAGCTYVISNQLFRKIQTTIGDNLHSCDQAVSHDWLIYAISRSYKYKWYYDKNSYIKYRQHDDNVQGALLGISGHIDRLKRIRKGWYKNAIMSLHPFLLQTTDEIKILERVKRGSLLDRVWLIVNYAKLRRNKWEAVMLALVFIFGRI
jgi:rhamnosyltransferase